MPTDMPPAADTPPVDELTSAEATLAELQTVVHRISADDLAKQTPCGQFDIGALTDHLMNSITTIGGAAGAEIPARNSDDSVERQIILAARPTLDAWRRRGLEGTVRIGSNEAPAKVIAGVLSIEFLIHAWDYARAIDQDLDPTPELADYVFTLARTIITPEGRTNVGFDDPIEIPDDAPVFDRLLAFTGRRPQG
ncbi:MAG: TIGR03086 family protein [Mycobacteriaceae bacterium]|nr:TIGR03086 family protein [Mycobacteriaceae bacterium]